MVRRAAFVAASAAVFVSGSARAEARSLRVDYQAPASCPNERRFVELARDRVREWPALDDQGELVARVRTEKTNGAFVGRLSLEDAAGRSLGARTIQEANCDDVVLALALFLAVALEADAESHAHPPAPPLEVPPPAPEAPAATLPPARVEQPRPPVDAPAPAPPPRSPPRDGRGLTLQVLARAHGVAGRMPDVAPGAALGVELGPRRRGSALRPFAGLGVDLAPYASQREGRGRIELGWGAVFARGCLALDLQPDDREEEDRVRFEPWLCARAEGGTLWAASHGYATNRTETLGWYAVGLEAGVSLWVSRLFSVGAFAHGMAPLVRHDLVLSQALLYRMPWITGEGGLELKMRIW